MDKSDIKTEGLWAILNSITLMSSIDLEKNKQRDRETEMN